MSASGRAYAERAALHHLLYPGDKGLAVLSLRHRTAARPTRPERHGFEVTDPASWLLATERGEEFGLTMTTSPYTYGRRVLSGIGTTCLCTRALSRALPRQRVLSFRWPVGIGPDARPSFLSIGGHLISMGVAVHGLVLLDEARPLGALLALQREMTVALAADGRAAWPVPVPTRATTRFITDPESVLAGAPTTGDQIVDAGLRPSAPRWST